VFALYERATRVEFASRFPPNSRSEPLVTLSLDPVVRVRYGGHLCRIACLSKWLDLCPLRARQPKHTKQNTVGEIAHYQKETTESIRLPECKSKPGRQ
jgi:hypothetical protein